MKTEIHDDLPDGYSVVAHTFYSLYGDFFVGEYDTLEEAQQAAKKHAKEERARFFERLHTATVRREQYREQWESLNITLAMNRQEEATG